VKTIKAFVAMTDRAHMPATTGIANLLCYEELIETGREDSSGRRSTRTPRPRSATPPARPATPRACCTATVRPWLHTYAGALRDALNVASADTVLPVVPMFHVNAWGLPYIACMVGAKLVLPGPFLDGKSLYELFEAERVTLSAGVPTVWQGLLTHVEANGLSFSTMRRTIVGGAACPPAMLRAFQERYDVQVLHAWGMTELSPIGTVCVPKGKHAAQSSEERLALQTKQGRVVFGVDMTIVGEDGRELPHDGKAAGELLVRGPWIVSRYFRGEAATRWCR
jgi:fatty-acyl-CoA synthase